MNKDTRWKQRFVNLERAFLFLKGGMEKEEPDPYQQVGIIKSFEFTFELCWKTMKDLLESRGISVSFPRDVLKEAFANRVIQDGHLWIEMLDERNALSHTYNEQQAMHAFLLVKNRYFPGLEQLYRTLKDRCSD